MKLEANTPTDYWTMFYNPSNVNFPRNTTVEATTLPIGLFVTIHKVGDRVELLSRAKYYERSAFAASLYEYLTKRYGSTVEAFTCVIRHTFLPETIGRSAIIRALTDNDGDVNWDWFNVVLMDSTGDWDAVDWNTCEAPEDVECLYQRQAEISNSSGLLLKVTQHDRVRFYRRPLEYRLVAAVVRQDQERIYMEYRNPKTGMKYTGIFTKGEKSIVDNQLGNRKNLIGTLVEISFKSVSRVKKDECKLYSVRFEKIVEDLPPPNGQLILV